jgi:hypothetical protein
VLICCLLSTADPTSCLSKLPVIIRLSEAGYHLFILPGLNWIMSSSLKTDKDVESTKIFNTSIDLTVAAGQGCPRHKLFHNKISFWKGYAVRANACWNYVGWWKKTGEVVRGISLLSWRFIWSIKSTTTNFRKGSQNMPAFETGTFRI